jgi:predicted transcriptional regulator
MPLSVRLDNETETLLIKTAKALDTTKSEILKASIRDFCQKTLQEIKKKPYDLISDLIGKEFSGQGNLAINSEEILRNAFEKKR